jgi:hypothetical protein
MDTPFGTEPPRADVAQFVSILSEAGRRRVSLSIALSEDGEWLARVIGSKNRLVYGVYRRHMKTIGYLGQIRQVRWGAGDNAQLEHNTLSAADSEIPRAGQRRLWALASAPMLRNLAAQPLS